MPTNSKHTRVMVDEIDLSTMSNNASVAIDSTADDVTTFQAPGNILLPGDPGMTISFAGYFTDAVDGLEDILQDRINNKAAFALQFGSDLPGSPAYILEDANTAALNVTAPIPGVIAVSGQPLTGAPRRGLVVGWGRYAAEGPGEEMDMNAAAVIDLRLLVHSLDGMTSNGVRVDVEHSVDGTGWQKLASFSEFEQPGVEDVIGVSADQRLRVNVTDLDGVNSVNLTVIAMLTKS